MTNQLAKLYTSICVIAIVALISFFYCATSTYPLVSDDWTYRFIFTQNRLVENLSDIITSQVIHWHRWGGRFVAHSLVQFFLLIDKNWFDIANTVCYTGCCAIIARVASNRNFLRNWLLVLASVWIVMPSPSGTMFWLTGSFNYLWPSCLSVLFLFLILSEKKQWQLAAIVIGLVAGNGHESIAVGFSWALILYAIVTRKKSLLFYVAIGSYILGMLSNVVAPGNFVRAASNGMAEQAGVLAYIAKYFKYFLKVGYRLTLNWSDLGVQCCTLLWCSAAYVCVKRWKDIGRQNLLSVLILSGAVVSLSLNVVSGVAHARAVYGFCFLAYLGCMLLFIRAGRESVKKLALGAILLANVIIIPRAYNDIRIAKESMENVYRECHEGRTLTSVISECDDALPSRYAGSPVSVSEKSPSNRYLASLLGVESISILRAADAAALERHHARIANASTHEMVDVDGYLGLVRLQGSPLKMTSSIKRSSHIKPGDSLLTKVKDWIARQQGLRGDFINVVRIGGGYYLFWERGISNGTVQMEYAEGTSVTINVD